MTSEAPWSVKGVDSETRQKLKQIAQDTGVTLGELISTLVEQQNSNRNNLFSKIQANGNSLDEKVGTEISEVKDTQKQPTPRKRTVKKTTARKATPKKVTAKKSATKTATKKTTTRKKATTAKKPVTNQKKAPSVFENLLNHTQGGTANAARRGKKLAVSVVKMPEDDLHEMVVEGRELRDALRLHTKELSKDIQKRIEKSIETQLNDIKNIVGNNTDGHVSAPKNHERTAVFLQEAQTLIDQSLNAHLSEVKQYLHDHSASNHNNVDHISQQEVQTIMEKVGQDILQSVDEKIFALQAQSSQNALSTETSKPLQSLNDNMRSIVDRLVDLEATCANLQQAKPQNVDNSAEFDKIHQELSHFMHSVPQQVKSLLAHSDNNIDQLNSSITALAKRVETVEEYAKTIPAVQPIHPQPQYDAPTQGHYDTPSQAIDNMASHIPEPSARDMNESMPETHPVMATVQPQQNVEDEYYEDDPFEEVSQEDEENCFEAVDQNEVPRAPFEEAPLKAQDKPDHNPFLDDDEGFSAHSSENETEALKAQYSNAKETLKTQYDNTQTDASYYDDPIDEADPLQSLEQHDHDTHNPFLDDDAQNDLPIEQTEFSEEFEDKEHTLDAWDAVDDDDSEDVQYDELGFEEPDFSVPNGKLNIENAEKKNNLNADIRQIDYHSMMSQTRRDTINQLDQRAILEQEKNAKQSKILSSLHAKTNKKNALIVGCFALAIILLLTVIYLTPST